VEQLECDAGLAPLGVEVGAVRPRSGALARGPGGYSRVSRASSARPSTSVHRRPAAWARRSTPDTVPSPMLRLWATSRWVRPRAHFWRRISRILRMDSRSVATAAPFPERPGRRTPQRRPASGGHSPPRGSPVHDDRSTCSRSRSGRSACRIQAFTLDRSRCSRSADLSVHDGPMRAATVPITSSNSARTGWRARAATSTCPTPPPAPSSLKPRLPCSLRGSSGTRASGGISTGALGVPILRSPPHALVT
jgi:hypothetical protein